MRRIILLNALLIFCLLSTIGQQTNPSQCKNLNAIITQMQKWRKNNTVIRFPLKSKRQKPLIGHGFLESGGLNKGTGAYYSSSAALADEYASEFGIDDEGKCFYTAYMGPYSKEGVDDEGKRLKNDFLSCINRAHWKITDVPNAYLQISFNPIDISVSIIKMSVKNSNMYRLAITMFRFKPLK